MADRYTKFILTVIAVALAFIAADRGVTRSEAQFDKVQKVQLCNSIGNCADLTPYRIPGMPSSLGSSYGLDVVVQK